MLLQQCLFDGEQSVLFGNHTLTVPQDYTKVPPVSIVVPVVSNDSLCVRARLLDRSR